MEIITDNALVHCQRGRILGLPVTGELTDLTEDLPLSRHVRQQVATVFDLTKGEASISGLARRHAEATLYVQVWDREQPIRTVALHGYGFAGIVHIQIALPEMAEAVYGGDVFGSFRDDLHESFSLDGDLASDRIWNVRNGVAEMSFPLNAWRLATERRQLFAYSVGGNVVFNDEEED